MEVAQLLVYDTNGIIFTLLASLQTKRRKRKRIQSSQSFIHACFSRTRFFLVFVFRVAGENNAPSILAVERIRKRTWEFFFTPTNPFLFFKTCIYREVSSLTS